MSWNEITTKLSAFFNTDIVKIVITITYIIVGIIAILSRTQLGKKILNNLKAKYDALVSYFKEYRENREKDITTIKENHEKAVAELKKEYETKLAIVNSRYEAILEVLKLIPNEKVQEMLKTLDTESKASDISEIVEQEKEKVKEEYESKIVELEERLAKLEEGAKNG